MAGRTGADIPLADHLVRSVTLEARRMSVCTRRDRNDLTLRFVACRAVRFFEVGRVADLRGEALY